jgi:hypothetical protein
LEVSRDANKLPLNDEFKVSYDYQPTYHYITSKTYKKDASTTLQESNVPSADGKTISRITIKENNVLKKQSDYLYDTYGNVIEERNFQDDWASYIPIKFSYYNSLATRNGAYLIRK